MTILHCEKTIENFIDKETEEEELIDSIENFNISLSEIERHEEEDQLSGDYWHSYFDRIEKENVDSNVYELFRDYCYKNNFIFEDIDYQKIISTIVPVAKKHCFVESVTNLVEKDFCIFSLDLENEKYKKNIFLSSVISDAEEEIIKKSILQNKNKNLLKNLRCNLNPFLDMFEITLKYKCSPGWFIDEDILKLMLEAYQEKIIEDKVRKIKSWDKNNIFDLKDMIQELDLFLGQIYSELKTDNFLDTSDLPSENFDNNLAGYPVWAVDKKGFCLVGASLCEVQSIKDIKKERK